MVQSEFAFLKELANESLQKCKKENMYHCAKISSRRTFFYRKAAKFKDFVVISRHPNHCFDDSKIKFKKDIEDKKFRIIDHIIC